MWLIQTRKLFEQWLEQQNDPDRQGVILCSGHKGNDKRFYQDMIALAEAEYDNHLKGQ